MSQNGSVAKRWLSTSCCRDANGNYSDDDEDDNDDDFKFQWGLKNQKLECEGSIIHSQINFDLQTWIEPIHLLSMSFAIS